VYGEPHYVACKVILANETRTAVKIERLVIQIYKINPQSICLGLMMNFIKNAQIQCKPLHSLRKHSKRDFSQLHCRRAYVAFRF